MNSAAESQDDANGKTVLDLDGTASSHANSELVHATEQFLSELEAGEYPSVDSYVQRYPAIGKQLRSCLENLIFLHDIAPQLSIVREIIVVDTFARTSIPGGLATAATFKIGQLFPARC